MTKWQQTAKQSHCQTEGDQTDNQNQQETQTRTTYLCYPGLAARAATGIQFGEQQKTAITASDSVADLRYTFTANPIQ